MEIVKNEVITEVLEVESANEITTEVAGNEVITALKKCEVCGKMLKKNAESTLCKKCTDIKNSEFGSNEQPQSEQLPETTGNDNEAKVDESKVKPGQAIRERFQALINKGKITDEIITTLSTKEGTNTLFKFNFAFLLEYDGKKTVKEQAAVKGHIRFSSKIYTINGKEYLMSNDIYLRNLEPFMKWCDSLDEQKDN